MRKIALLFALPLHLLAAPYSGDPKLLAEEIHFLDRLEKATEQSLQNQKKLKETLLAYRQQLDTYLKNPSDKDLAMKVSRKANRLLEEIKSNFLLDSFETGFISELTLFAQLSEKKGIPKP